MVDSDTDGHAGASGKELHMRFDMAVIDNLGLRMYQTIPPVVAELIANSYDADAERVGVNIENSDDGLVREIRVKDDGTGMSFKELENQYLKIGRRKRNIPDQTTNKGRLLMGRKGIGKLSSFGVAKHMRLRTVKDGLLNEFEMHIDAIRDSKEGVYKPSILTFEEHVPGQKAGTEVVLSEILERKIDVESLEENLGRRFSILSKGFRVSINGRDLKPLREVLEGRFEFEPESIDETIGPDGTLKVHGWMGVLDKIPRNMSVGIVVHGHGKLVQEPFFFGEPAGRQYAYSYMVGEICADFLDEQAEDIVATDRKSIDWEANPGAVLLLKWGKDKIRDLSDKWDTQKRKKKRKKLLETQPMQDWYAELTSTERAIADRVLDVIVAADIDDDKLRSLGEYVANSMELEAFADVADRFRATPPEDFARLVELMQEWSVLEARGTLSIIEGRLKIIDTLEEFVKTNVYEKKIQSHLYESPWLIHPTWLAWEKEKSLATLVKEEFPDPEGKRRVDLVCVGAAHNLYVVELKRPDVKLNYDDITQLKGYVAFLEEKIGAMQEGYQQVSGYLIGNEFLSDRLTKSELGNIKNSRGKYSVMTYDVMISQARRLHEAFLQKARQSRDET